MVVAEQALVLALLSVSASVANQVLRRETGEERPLAAGESAAEAAAEERKGSHDLRRVEAEVREELEAEAEEAVERQRRCECWRGPGRGGWCGRRCGTW
jgi:hypothetical protein